MGLVREWISKAVDSDRLDVCQADDSTAASVRRQVEALYATPAAGRPLWERLLDSDGEYDPEGWKRIESYPHDGRVLLFFDPQEEPAVYSARNCREAVGLLSACPGFVFYLTDELCSFLICHNDHDHLIGAGKAKAWVRRRHGSPGQTRG